MAKILAGTVEVTTRCALQWHSLLSYMTNESFLESTIAGEQLFVAAETAKIMARNVPVIDAERLEEYQDLRTKMESRDIPGAIEALHRFRAKVVPLMIKDVVGCECER